jgi:cytochrome c oxidase assembly protein subunit 15
MANAILGKYVVDSFLLAGVVTAHMLLTTGVLFFLLKALNNSAQKRVLNSSDRVWILINAVIIFTQIILGTQVRENMDHVIVDLGYNAKNTWIDHLANIYIVHRTFSWLIIFSHVYLWKKISTSADFHTYKWSFATLISLSLLSGVIMAYTALPMGSQPIHLATSLLLLGLHFHAWQRKTHDASETLYRFIEIETFDYGCVFWNVWLCIISWRTFCLGYLAHFFGWISVDGCS